MGVGGLRVSTACDLAGWYAEAAGCRLTYGPAAIVESIVLADVLRIGGLVAGIGGKLQLTRAGVLCEDGGHARHVDCLPVGDRSTNV